MSSSETTPHREALHRRRIDIVGYKREDGLFDIEGHLVDAKDVPFAVGRSVREPGEPVHDMWLRLTVDRAFRIVAAEARTSAMPYRGTCERITPDYAKLVGLVIGPGYLRGLKERLGGVAGCTHLTQLAGGHSLRIDEIKPGTPTAARRFVIVPIVVLGSGSFSDCAAYLRTIHERYPDVGLTALNLRGEPDKPERGARFTFDLAWYAAPGAAQSKK